MIKIISVTLLLVMLSSFRAYAVVASPFGLEIGKATIQDVETKYKIISKQKSAFGYFYIIDPGSFLLLGVTTFHITCSDDGVIKAIHLRSTDKSKFVLLFESLFKEYKMEKENSSFEKDESIKFLAENCFISVTRWSDNNISTMSINFSDKEFDKIVKKELAQIIKPMMDRKLKNMKPGDQDKLFIVGKRN